MAMDPNQFQDTPTTTADGSTNNDTSSIMNGSATSSVRSMFSHTIEKVTSSYHQRTPSKQCSSTSGANNNLTYRRRRDNINPSLFLQAKKTIASKLLEGFSLKGNGEVCFRCQMPLMISKQQRVQVENQRDDDETRGSRLPRSCGICVVCEEEEVSEEDFERKMIMFSGIHANKVDSKESEDDEEEEDANEFEKISGENENTSENELEVNEGHEVNLLEMQEKQQEVEDDAATIVPDNVTILPNVEDASFIEVALRKRCTSCAMDMVDQYGTECPFCHVAKLQPFSTFGNDSVLASPKHRYQDFEDNRFRKEQGLSIKEENKQVAANNTKNDADSPNLANKREEAAGIVVAVADKSVLSCSTSGNDSDWMPKKKTEALSKYDLLEPDSKGHVELKILESLVNLTSPPVNKLLVGVSDNANPGHDGSVVKLYVCMPPIFVSKKQGDVHKEPATLLTTTDRKPHSKTDSATSKPPVRTISVNEVFTITSSHNDKSPSSSPQKKSPKHQDKTKVVKNLITKFWLRNLQEEQRLKAKQAFHSSRRGRDGDLIVIEEEKEPPWDVRLAFTRTKNSMRDQENKSGADITPEQEMTSTPRATTPETIGYDSLDTDEIVINSPQPLDQNNFYGIDPLSKDEMGASESFVHPLQSMDQTCVSGIDPLSKDGVGVSEFVFYPSQPMEQPCVSDIDPISNQDIGASEIISSPLQPMEDPRCAGIGPISNDETVPPQDMVHVSSFGYGLDPPTAKDAPPTSPVVKGPLQVIKNCYNFSGLDPPEAEENTVVSKESLNDISHQDFHLYSNTTKNASPPRLPKVRRDDISAITFHTHQESDVFTKPDPAPLLPDGGDSYLAPDIDDVLHQLAQLEHQFSLMEEKDFSSSSSMPEYQCTPPAAVEHSPSTNNRRVGGHPFPWLLSSGCLATISEGSTDTRSSPAHYNNGEKKNTEQQWVPLSPAAVARRRHYKAALMAKNKSLAMPSSIDLVSIE